MPKVTTLYDRIKRGDKWSGSGRTPAEWRFWAKVDKNGPIHPIYGQCWLWLASKFLNGYGQFVPGKSVQEKSAHRYSWILHYGEIPEGLCVLHRCDNPECTRPEHLFLGTDGDNMRDKVEKGRQTAISMPGERNPNRKLTEEQVHEIRRRYDAGCHPKVLARCFSVTPTMIRFIGKRKNWQHV